MRFGKDSDRRRLGPVRKLVSPSPRVIFGTVIGQALLTLVALGFTVSILLAELRPARGAPPPSRGADWVIPVALIVAGELARRWTNRRLMSLHEGGVTYIDRRTLRAIAWADIEQAELGEGSCRLRLRGGEEIDLPRPLARSEEVRAAVMRARAA